MMIEKAITKLYNEIIQFIDSETDDIMAYGPILINNRDWSFGQLDSDFYSGLSGILLAISAYSHYFSDKNSNALAIKIYKIVREKFILSSKIGFSGISGNIYALIISNQYIKFENTIGLLKNISYNLEKVNITKYETDFLDGLSSLLLLNYRTLKAFRHNLICRKKIDEIINYIFSKYKDEWFPSKNFHNPISGLSHGYTGYAIGLSSAYILDKNKSLLEKVLRLLKLEDNLFNFKDKNWPDLRFPCKKYNDYWCHGSLGIFLGRREINKITGAQFELSNYAYKNSVNMINKCNNLSLCHGITGLSEILIKKPYNYQNNFLDLLLKIISSRECGLPIQQNTIGFMLGLSGALYQLLRIIDPIKYKNALLLNI